MEGEFGKGRRSFPGAGLFLAEDFRRAVWFFCLVVPTASLFPRSTQNPGALSAPAVCVHAHLHSNACSREDAAHPLARLVLHVIPAPKRALGHRSPPWSHPSPPSLGAESSPGAGSGHGGAGWALIPSGTASSRAVAT